jgi:hypothetical protein
MAEPRWDQRGPVDRYGRPLMPRPEWIGPDKPPPPPDDDEPPPVWIGGADPLPIPKLPVTRQTPYRSNLDCGEAVWLTEHTRIGSPIPVAQRKACYKAVKPWSAQALATGVKETELGKTASGANNFLNLFVPAGDEAKDCVSWEACAKEWYARLSDATYKGFVYGPRAASIEQVVVTYQGGPGCWTSKGKTCANNETWTPGKAGSIELAIRQFVARVNTVMGHPQKVPWSIDDEIQPPPGQPTIYTLAKDYARFGLTKQRADTLRGWCFQNRSGQRSLLLMLHVQEGNTAGSLGWWLDGYVNGVKVQASSTVMIQQDGSILRVVDEEDGPWTNGDTCSPNARGQRALAQCMGGNPNLFTKSIEFEGYWNREHSKAQLDAGAWQVKTWQAADGLDNDDVYRHGDLNSCSRPNCCGSILWDGVMARL